MSKKTKKRLAALEAKVEELAERIERDFLTRSLERDIRQGGPVAEAIEAFTRPDFAGASKEGSAAAATEEVFGPRDAYGWYEWNGGETMRPAGMVDVILRCDKGQGEPSGTCSADALRWTRDGKKWDIVKWRPAQ